VLHMLIAENGIAIKAPCCGVEPVDQSQLVVVADDEAAKEVGGGGASIEFDEGEAVGAGGVVCGCMRHAVVLIPASQARVEAGREALLLQVYSLLWTIW
jgi:hypothetical protein